MPRCRNCHAPIFFLTEQPKYYNAGTWDKPKQMLSEVSPKPFDVDPSPAGTFGIYEYVGKRYVRRLHDEALRIYKHLGGAVYRIHFETCPNRQQTGRQR